MTSADIRAEYSLPSPSEKLPDIIENASETSSLSKEGVDEALKVLQNKETTVSLTPERERKLLWKIGIYCFPFP